MEAALKQEWEKALRLAHKITYLQAAQEIAGVAFDAEKAKSLVSHIQAEMAKIESEVEPQLPPRKLKKSEEALYTLPKRPYRQDGSLSEVMLKWIAKHGVEHSGTALKWFDGNWYQIVGSEALPATMPMKLGNRDDIVDWLLSLGWKPVFWNLKKDKRGKPVRDDRGKEIRTSPKTNEGDRICPELLKMDLPLVRSYVRWKSYGNRLGVINGWLENKRLAFDGRLTAAVSGITNTFRVKHSVVANLPKAEDGILLGKEMRGLFVADEGMVFVGYDAAQLDARGEAHYVFPYPGGEEYAREIIEGDLHSRTAKFVWAKELEAFDIHAPDFNKDDPRFKPYRSKAKGVKYSITYGAGPAKVARLLGETRQRGEEIYERFWESAAPLAAFRDALNRFWETTGQKKYLIGIDGRKIWTRSAHALVNTIIQTLSSVVMDLSHAWMDRQLGGVLLDSTVGTCYYRYRGFKAQRLIQYHDEAAWQASPEIAEEIGQLGVESIKWAGRYLKLNVPLDGSYKLGKSWKDVH